MSGTRPKTYTTTKDTTFGRCGAGRFWWLRRRGFAPNSPAKGPFATSYSAFHDALQRPIDPPQFGRTIARLSTKC
jgi:hypothetical protein